MLVEEGLDLVLSHLAADDVALGVYEGILRNVVDIVKLADLTLPVLEVRYMIPGQLIVLDALEPCVSLSRDTPTISRPSLWYFL